MSPANPIALGSTRKEAGCAGGDCSLPLGVNDLWRTFGG